ncbi:hypothetical protein [Streptomyces sp. NPDC048527]|uniref:hypothetical protein n=1 Tax=Streptomyces sp. NPDC048527 TaxID=3365568 RepID=UPI00371F94EE
MIGATYAAAIAGGVETPDAQAGLLRDGVTAGAPVRSACPRIRRNCPLRPRRWTGCPTPGGCEATASYRLGAMGA